MMISKMKRTTNKAKEEPTPLPPLYSLPIKNTTFLSRPICSICRAIQKCMGESLG